LTHCGETKTPDPFSVPQYDDADRFIVARTLAGHPLAGWRYWGVSELGNGDILVETYSVEHPYTWYDRYIKMGLAPGLRDMYSTWTNMLNDVVARSGGAVVAGPDTQLGGVEQPDRVAERINIVDPEGMSQ
jgi:hypothetical protein